MSYCRFSDADVYIFESSTGGECCACPLHPEPFGSYVFDTRTELLTHIATHREAGHYVPESVDADLRGEIESVGDRFTVDES